MKILMVGGTGLVGSAVVKELMKHSADVRVLARKKSAVAEADKEGVEIAESDLAKTSAALVGFFSLRPLSCVSAVDLSSANNTSTNNPMNTHSITAQLLTPLPADDPDRNLKIARPDTDQSLPHIGLVGDTYTVLLSGNDTDGRYCLIDMHIPPGGGPPPHRHDFEESFTVLAGEIQATFRGEKSTVRAGETLNIPANAPHSFTNASKGTVRLLCLCAPAGQEEFFAQVDVSVATRTTPPPELSKEAQAASRKKAEELAPKYRTELINPGPIAAIMRALQ